MAWLTGYTKRKKITIDQTKIDTADFADFAVLVKLTSANFNFAEANSDGFDIRFTGADGTTLFKYERERHDSANSLAEYWVKVSNIDYDEDTIFYLYYRTEDTADGADPENVWDSNFKMVQHLKDATTSTVLDSTANNNDGTKKAANEPIEATGQIYNGQNFDGSNDYIALPNNAFKFSAFTVDFWIQDSTASDFDTRGAFANFGYDAYGYKGFGVRAGRSADGFDVGVIFGVGTWAPADRTYTPNPAVSDNNWHHIAVSYDGTTARCYFDGVEIGNFAPGTVSYLATAKNQIGAANDAGSYALFYRGKQDEVRVSNIARSAAWVKASYSAGKDTLLSYISEKIPTGFVVMF